MRMPLENNLGFSVRLINADGTEDDLTFISLIFIYYYVFAFDLTILVLSFDFV